MNNRVLVIDDEVGWVEVCQASLANEEIDVVGASTFKQGAQQLENQSFDVCLLDLNLPDGHGLDLLPIARRNDPDLLVVIITAYPTIETAIKATREGAYDYLVKPFSPDQLRLVVSRALERQRLQGENRLLAGRLHGHADNKIVGEAPAMRAVFEHIEQVAPTQSEVLITGESGTGKELVARAIHRLSLRRDARFVPVDCGTLPETLIESELFGHEKGAFTGANRRQIGLFDYARGGTIFFDEIGELALSSQVKLLRVIQEHQFRRVGGRATIDSDVRLIAATNRPLDEEVKAGRFREDLFYRLDVFRIDLPPLRERPGDIRLLVPDLIVQVAEELGVKTSCDESVIEHLEKLEWPGNVRQLKNTLKSASIRAQGRAIQIEDLPPELHFVDVSNPSLGVTGDGGFKDLRAGAIEQFESSYLMDLMSRHEGSIASACEEAHLSRSTLYYLLQRHEIEAASFRDDDV